MFCLPKPQNLVTLIFFVKNTSFEMIRLIFLLIYVFKSVQIFYYKRTGRSLGFSLATIYQFMLFSCCSCVFLHKTRVSCYERYLCHQQHKNNENGFCKVNLPWECPISLLQELFKNYLMVFVFCWRDLMVDYCYTVTKWTVVLDIT